MDDELRRHGRTGRGRAAGDLRGRNGADGGPALGDTSGLLSERRGAGAGLGLPQTARDVSPFTYQKAPALDASGVAVAALPAVAVALLATGPAPFRSRDLASG